MNIGGHFKNDTERLEIPIERYTKTSETAAKAKPAAKATRKAKS